MEMEVIRYEKKKPRSFGDKMIFLLLKSMRLANCFKLARLLRLIAFLRNFQKTEYRSAVLFFLMLLFAIAAHWLACIFHFIAILERPNLPVKYSWLDHLAEKYKMPYRMLILSIRKTKLFIKNYFSY
jgi:hypothetical protein